VQVYHQANEVPQTLKISVQTRRPEKICIRVEDAARIPGTNKTVGVYEDRWQIVNGTQSFFVKLPFSPNRALIQVFNHKNGNTANDASFMWKMEPMELRRAVFPWHIPSRQVREFILFAEAFSKQKNLISAGFKGRPNSIYRSFDGTLQIDYYDQLLDMRQTIFNFQIGAHVKNPRYMHPVSTVMRTQADTGIIEVSKSRLSEYSVPETFAILAHEFCHTKVNKNPADEEEADRNAAIICLCSGMGKIATYTAFLKVFRKADSAMNREREQKLYKFIEKFNAETSWIVG
jgi:hypothetical protein